MKETILFLLIELIYIYNLPYPRITIKVFNVHRTHTEHIIGTFSLRPHLKLPFEFITGSKLTRIIRCSSLVRNQCFKELKKRTVASEAD